MGVDPRSATKEASMTALLNVLRKNLEGVTEPALKARLAAVIAALELKASKQ
jgi:hypothetical protein